jgi:hypothetical protein
MHASGKGAVMSSQPSIKGSVFSAVVEDVNKLLTRGGISKTELARRLPAEDILLLGQTIGAASWYDIRAYTRMSELLRDVDGDGSNDYLRERGRQTARRLLEAGFYAQLEYLHRAEVGRTTGARARFEAFGRDLRKLTTLSGSILNFSRWSSKIDPQREGCFLLEVAEARDFPEVLAWRSEGFVNEMGTAHGDPDLWCWERVSPELIIFRMNRPV